MEKPFTISKMIKSLSEQIHDLIEDAKILRGIKKKELAKRLDISPTQLSNLLTVKSVIPSMKC
jgi:transcriptional regulator with XRE-family HTH domain